jgi:hypothetical protein
MHGMLVGTQISSLKRRSFGDEETVRNKFPQFRVLSYCPVDKRISLSDLWLCGVPQPVYTANPARDFGFGTSARQALMQVGEENSGSM